MRPSIVVTGSAQADRDYTPPLREAGTAPAACEAIGRELAKAGCDLVVFSSSDDYIEKDVVRGYLQALDPARPGRVVVRAPYDREVEFGVPEQLRRLIETEPSTATEWEVSYYRSLCEADGILVVGGGRATRIAGTLGIARSTPVVALAMFGAAALTVWQQLDRFRNHASEEDMHRMAGAWTESSAARLVDSLLGQIARSQQAAREQAREGARLQRARTVNSLLGAGALVLAAVTVWLGFWTRGTAGAVGCLLSGPLLAAIGGALLRDATSQEQSTVWSAARGLGAGILAVTLYVGSQQLTNADQLTADSARRLAWFLVPLGLAAGYTVDYVFAKLSRVDVLSDQPFSGDRPN